MKKLLKVVLGLMLTVSMAACGTTDTGSDAGAGYKAGTYTGVAAGRNADITVEVVLSETAIESVTITDHAETADIAAPAISGIPEAIVTHQSLGVDAISGATITSDAIVAAVANALESAGADVEALKNVEVKVEAGEPIEKTVDVVIVGGGGAGISAAAAATEKGAKVILIEKTAALGGNTLACGGVFNTISEELIEKTAMMDSKVKALEAYLEMDEAEFEGEYLNVFKTLKGQITEYLNGDKEHLFDSIELHTIQTYLGGKRTDLDGNEISGNFELVTTLTTKSYETAMWMTNLWGAEWEDYLSEPIGSMWLRSLKAVGNDKKTNWFDKPAAYVTENGGEIMYNTTADKILTEDGKAVGVHATMADGTDVTVHANAVIITTGGFGANTEMVMQYDNYWGDDLYAEIGTTNVNSTVGEGIVMAQEALNAAVTGMEFTQLMPISFASNGILALGNGSNVIFVNPEGERYVNEYAERDVLSKAAFEFGGEEGLFYEVSTRETSINLPPMWNDTDCYEAKTLEEVAAMVGIPAEALVNTVNTYNTYVDNQYDEDFQKEALATRIELKSENDTYTIRVMKPSIHHTMGGLMIDGETHVYNTDGEVISGLYAAGEVIGGMHAGNRLGGNAITDIYTFGRIAGYNAAEGK